VKLTTADHSGHSGHSGQGRCTDQECVQCSSGVRQCHTLPPERWQTTAARITTWWTRWRHQPSHVTTSVRNTWPSQLSNSLCLERCCSPERVTSVVVLK